MLRLLYREIIAFQSWKAIPLLMSGLIVLWTVGVSLAINPSPPASPYWEPRDLGWIISVSPWLLRVGVVWSIGFIVISEDKIKHLIYGVIQNFLLFLTHWCSTVYLLIEYHLLK